MAKNENIQTDKSSNQAVDSGTAAEKIIKGARATGNGSRESVQPEKVSIKEKMSQRKILEELEKMYDPENFKGLVRAPADMAMMVSGRKLWNLSENEVNTLASSASVTARYFIVSDPKWLALTMFSMSILTVYGTRIALHVREVREEKEAKIKKKNETP